MSLTGAIILAFFATVWWIVGLRAAGHGPAMVYAVPAVIAARHGRLVGWASAGEGVAIFVVANVLVNTGHSDAIAPAVALIVGAHFVPLARSLPVRAYYVTATALVALGGFGLTIAGLPMRLTRAR